jgi:hypothetical protein
MSGGTRQRRSPGVTEARNSSNLVIVQLDTGALVSTATTTTTTLPNMINY